MLRSSTRFYFFPLFSQLILSKNKYAKNYTPKLITKQTRNAGNLIWDFGGTGGPCVCESGQRLVTAFCRTQVYYHLCGPNKAWHIYARSKVSPFFQIRDLSTVAVEITLCLSCKEEERYVQRSYASYSLSFKYKWSFFSHKMAMFKILILFFSFLFFSYLIFLDFFWIHHESSWHFPQNHVEIKKLFQY